MGLIGDGVLNDAEIQFLNLWLSDNQEIAQTWPAEVIYSKVKSVLSDGMITEQERDHLKKVLSDVLGGDLEDTGAASGLSTKLPIDKIESIEIPLSSFCFTGNFLYGTRSACERAIEQRQGSVQSRVTIDLDYLVIGTLTSREWAHTSFGRKIEQAMDYKKKGAEIRIINEEQWVQFL